MEGINSLFVSSISMPDENLPENFLATVGAVYDDGLSLILEGQTEATTKHYKCNTSATFAAGVSAVRCMKSMPTSPLISRNAPCRSATSVCFLPYRSS